MQGNFRKFFAWSWSACMLLVLSACGGAGGGGSTQLAVETATISGSALKGPIKGALVQVFRLNSNGTKGELLGSGSTGNDGAYAIEVPKAKALAPLLVTVTGQSGASYTSESKGSDVDFSAAESFHAVLDSFEPGRKYTVGPLTEAAYQQLQKFVTDNPSLAADSRIVSAANARIATLFNVRDILADPATDPAYSTSLRIIDRMVEVSKVSGAGNTLQTMNLMNQAFVDVTRPAYQTYRAALISAANLVKGDVALAASVDAMLATAANPPAEPDWTDATAPQAVTELRARAGAETATTGSVTLSWSAATSTGQNRVTGYQVYRNGTRIASVSYKPATWISRSRCKRATATTSSPSTLPAIARCPALKYRSALRMPPISPLLWEEGFPRTLRHFPSRT